MIDHSQHEILQDEEGLVTVEYVVVLILICVAGITGWVAWNDAVEADASAQYQTFGYPP